MKSSKRFLYIDVIKILAILLVILLHCSANFIYSVKVTSFDFAVLNFFDSMSRIGVPLFFMVSGAYFLNNNNNVTIKSIFKKNIFKILLVLIISSFSIEFTKYLIIQNNITLKMFLKNVILGDIVLWFFYTLIGLYIITPILREITKSKEKTQYFIFLYFIFIIIFKYILLFYKGKTLASLYNNLSITMFNGYVGYYVLGYYLSVNELSNNKKKILYVLGLIGFLLTFTLTKYFSIKNGKLVVSFYDNNSLNVFLYSLAMFVLIKSIFKDKTHNNLFIKQLSNLTISVYPVHRILLIVIEYYFGFNITNNFVYMIPLYFIIIATLSYIISYIISLIVKKLYKFKILFYYIYFSILISIVLVLYLQ